LKAILDDTCEVFNTKWQEDESQIREQSEQFENAINLTYQLFGGDSFRKWNGTKFESRFNRAVFDIMVFYFTDKKVAELAVDRSSEIVDGFKLICDGNREFRASLETTFKSIKSTYMRLSVWGGLLNELGIHVEIPSLVNDRIVFGQ